MSVVISDASPVVVLVKIGHVDLLRDVFDEVYIPPQVESELLDPVRPLAVRAFVSARPAWLRVMSPAALRPIPPLHAGETAAICLAEELAPATLLIDERDGRRVATRLGLRVTGTVGFLKTAAEEGRVDLARAFAAIKATDFWFSHDELDAILAAFLARQARK